MRPLVFLVQWPFEPSHPSLGPIDNIMHYRVILCAVYCGLQLAVSLSGHSTSSPHSSFARWETLLPLGPAANVITPHLLMFSSVEGKCQYDNLWYSVFLSCSQNSCLHSLIAMEQNCSIFTCCCLSVGGYNVNSIFNLVYTCYKKVAHLELTWHR